MFELAQAFVSLTNRGFDQTITSTDDVEVSLRKLMSQADASTESVDKGLVDAMANAASEMIKVGESGDVAAEGFTKSAEAAEKTAAALEDVYEPVVRSEKSVEELNAELAKTNGVAENAAKGFKKVGDEAATAAKKAEELADETKRVNDETSSGGSGGSGGGILEEFEAGKDALDSLREKTEAFVAKASEGPGKFAQMARGAARIGGLITLAVGAASQLYQWGIETAEAWSGFNDANAEALEGLKAVGAQQQRITQDAIRDANNLNSKKETLIALEAKLVTAQNANAGRQKTKDEKEEALTPGTLGQFNDGKVNSELVPEFERAEAAAASSQKTVDALAAEIRRLKIEGKDFKLGLAKDLERATILANEGEQALRQFDLVAKGLTVSEAAGQASAEAALKLQEEKAQAGKALAETFRQQLAALELSTIELTEGKEAAAEARDIAANFTPQMREQLATARAMNAEAVKAKELKDKNTKLAEEETRRNEALGRSFAQQANSLAAKNIALQKGNEAAAKFKDEAKGFTESQRESLAILRARNEALTDLDKAKKEEKKLTDKAADEGGSFIGFSDLAKSANSSGDSELRKAQKETARATAALAKQAASEGIRIKELSTAAPKVDRRFGRGATGNRREG